MTSPAVTVDLPYEQDRNRLTTFFRYPLAFVPALWSSVLWIGVFFCTVVAWFALLITGRYPASLYAFNRYAVRYGAKSTAYFLLVTDRFPGFKADEPADYPVQLRIGEPLPAYDRVKVLLRLFLMIPPYLIAYAMNIVAFVGAILAWFVIVFTGKLPRGIHGITRLGLSYQLRVMPYMLLMTESWPAFSQDGDLDALRDPADTMAVGPSAGADAFGVPTAPAELPGGFQPPQPPPTD